MELDYLDDKMLAFLELKDDIFFDKLCKQQIAYYIESSIKIGKEVALRYKDDNIEKKLKENNIDIKIGTGNSINIRAQAYFTKDTGEIIIYKNSINNIYKIALKENIDLSEEDIYNIHLIHEYYHFLEYKNNMYTDELLKRIQIGKIIKRNVKIVKSREISAHIFCKNFLSLDLNPKILDYLYLFDKNPNIKNKFRENILEFKRVYLVG